MPSPASILAVIRQAQDAADPDILHTAADRIERTDPDSANHMRAVAIGMSRGVRGGGRGVADYAEGNDREPFVGLPISLSITTAVGAFNSGTFNPPGAIDYYINGISILKPATGEYQMLSVGAGNNTTNLTGSVSGGAGTVVGHPVDLLDPRIMQGYDDLLVVNTDVAARDFTFYFSGDTAGQTLYLTAYCLPSGGMDAGGARSRFLGPARAQSLRRLVSRVFKGPGSR